MRPTCALVIVGASINHWGDECYTLVRGESRHRRAGEPTNAERFITTADPVA